MESGDSQQVVLPSSPSSGGETPAESPSSGGGPSGDPATGSGGADSSPSTSSFPMRKRLRRNPAVLIRWIEDHPFNPYPTKGEKQGLAFYAGMTQRQLNDWFANARRNIKKVGYENWKKKHNGFSAILSGIPLASNNNCGLSVLSAGSSSTSGSGAPGHGINSSFGSHPFTNTAFAIAPLNRPTAAGYGASAAAPCSVMSYPSANGHMACVKPTPLPSPASFVKVEGGGAYYGGGYSLAHAAAGDISSVANSLSSCSSASTSSFCLSSLPFSHESYQLAAAAGAHTQTAAGPLLAAAVDGNIRPFSTPTTAATIPYIACDQCTPSGSTSAVPHHPAVLYNWAAAHQPVPMGSTTVLNHAGFAGGLMAAHTPSPPPPQSQCADSAEHCSGGNSQGSGGDSLQTQEQESTSSPHESGYYSGATSPTPTHHTR